MAAEPPLLKAETRDRTEEKERERDRTQKSPVSACLCHDPPTGSSVAIFA
jgi:hypothetical protein